MATNRSSRPGPRDAAKQPADQPDYTDQPADQPADAPEVTADPTSPAASTAPEPADSADAAATTGTDDTADPTDTAPGSPTADGAPVTPSATTTGDASAATNGDNPKRKYTRTVLKDVPLDALGEPEFVPESEWEQTPLTDSGTATRSPAQMKIDTDFKELFDKWVAAGKPDPRHSDRSRRRVSPENAPAIRKMISDAAKLYDVVAKFSPPSHDQNGNEIIVYSPVPKVKRPRKPAELPPGTTLATAESAPSASGGSLPGE